MILYAHCSAVYINLRILFCSVLQYFVVAAVKIYINHGGDIIFYSSMYFVFQSSPL